MIIVILFVILALVTGSSLALLQGYLRLSKEIKEKELLRNDIDEAVQKVKVLIAKKEPKIHKVDLSSYNRDIFETGRRTSNLGHHYIILKESIAPVLDYNYVKKPKTSIKIPKTNGVPI